MMPHVNHSGAAGSVVVDTSQSAGARLRPVAVTALTLDGGLWRARCDDQVRITFLGGADSVTGSKYLVEAEGLKVLLD
jgi:hypothetical protein